MTEYNAAVVNAPLRFSEIEMCIFAEGYTARETFPASTSAIEQRVLKMCAEYCQTSEVPKPIKSIQITYR